uniref:Uncharacterized protein n=1 Tax=Rhizophora mucronata TaxID=61149 RepID=A0A2P2Q9T5_RHIMU
MQNHCFGIRLQSWKGLSPIFK